jgi:hypothetical protein
MISMAGAIRIKTHIDPKAINRFKEMRIQAPNLTDWAIFMPKPP